MREASFVFPFRPSLQPIIILQTPQHHRFFPCKVLSPLGLYNMMKSVANQEGGKELNIVPQKTHGIQRQTIPDSGGNSLVVRG